MIIYQITSLSLSRCLRRFCELYQIKSASASKSTTDGVDLDFTAFKSCHAVFTYCGPKTGTSTMKPPARRGCPRGRGGGGVGGGGIPYVNDSSLPVFRRFSLDMGNKFRKSPILSCDNSFNGFICDTLMYYNKLS